MAKFYLSGFADEAGNKIKEQIEALKAHGMTHIEPRGLDLGNVSFYTAEQAKELKKVLDDNGISVSSMGSCFGKIEITDDFAPHFEEFKNAIEVCNVLGTENIRMFSFFFTKGEKFEDYRDEVFERLDKFATYSRENGIWCCHENEKEIYGDNVERCLEILKTFDGRIKGVFDPANFIQCGVEILPAYEVLKDYIKYFHVKDCRASDGFVVPAGKGDADIVELIKRVNKDFDGDIYMSLEPHLKVFRGLEGLEGEGGTADKLKDDFSYPTNRAAFDAAADAFAECITEAGLDNITVRKF